MELLQDNVFGLFLFNLKQNQMIYLTFKIIFLYFQINTLLITNYIKNNQELISIK